MFMFETCQIVRFLAFCVFFFFFLYFQVQGFGCVYVRMLLACACSLKYAYTYSLDGHAYSCPKTLICLYLFFLCLIYMFSLYFNLGCQISCFLCVSFLCFLVQGFGCVYMRYSLHAYACSWDGHADSCLETLIRHCLFFLCLIYMFQLLYFILFCLF